jgi:hypothetical protein
MVAIQIRDVPDAMRDELAAQAKARGQSLQAYLLDVLKERADAGHNRRLLTEWARNPLITGSEPFDTVGYLATMRKEREQELARRVAPRQE